MPTPTATATPLEMTDAGDRAIIAGDYDRAIEIFQNALANTTDTTVTDKSNLGIGQAYYEQSNYAPALTALRLAAASADTTIAARANYFLAQSYISLERYDEPFNLLWPILHCAPA